MGNNEYLVIEYMLWNVILHGVVIYLINLNTKNMKTIKVINRAEMKQFMGGVMDRETTSAHCINKVENTPSTCNADYDYIFVSVGTNMFYDAYENMPS